MFILHNFECNECEYIFEELVDNKVDDNLDKLDNLDIPPCPKCNAKTHKVLSYNPTSISNPRQAEIMMKGRNIKNKLQGKVPWRKNSESQSS